MISIKAQVGIEYLVVVGIIFLIIVPLTLIYLKYSGESSYAVTTSKVDLISNEIVNAANQVNVYGQDTQVKLTVDFPEGVQSDVTQGKEITFIILTKDGQSVEIAKVADVIFSTVTYDSIIAGKHDIIVKSLGSSQVSIQIKWKKAKLE